MNWNKSVTVMIANQSTTAEVRDESISGLGLYFPEAVEVGKGRRVKVDNGNFSRVGEVVYIEPDSVGGCRMGVKFTPDTEYESSP
jgi:hypothetical protein